MRVFLLSVALVLSVGCAKAPPTTPEVPSSSAATAQRAASSESISAAVVPIPTLQGRVNDFANILTPQERAELSSQLATYERETTHQIAILTVATLHGEPIESFSLRVANSWKLGQKGVDNGVLVTMVLQDHKARIELGKGLSRFVSDATAADIMNGLMVPEFRLKHYGKGIQRGVERLMDACRAYNVQR